MTEVTIEARGLRKRYGSDIVLDDVDLTARRGEVLALLGPNGAGKTTAVRILATLVRPDGGRATVAGHDVVRHPARVREVISLTGQYAAVDHLLTGRENLVLMAVSGGSAGRTHDAGPSTCSTCSGSPTPPTAWCAPTPVACGGGSTSQCPW